MYLLFAEVPTCILLIGLIGYKQNRINSLLVSVSLSEISITIFVYRERGVKVNGLEK